MPDFNHTEAVTAYLTALHSNGSSWIVEADAGKMGAPLSERYTYAEWFDMLPPQAIEEAHNAIATVAIRAAGNGTLFTYMLGNTSKAFGADVARARGGFVTSGFYSRKLSDVDAGRLHGSAVALGTAQAYAVSIPLVRDARAGVR